MAELNLIPRVLENFEFQKIFFQACSTSKIVSTHENLTRLRILRASYIEKHLETKVWGKDPYKSCFSKIFSHPKERV